MFLPITLHSVVDSMTERATDQSRHLQNVSLILQTNTRLMTEQPDRNNSGEEMV